MDNVFQDCFNMGQMATDTIEVPDGPTTPEPVAPGACAVPCMEGDPFAVRDTCAAPEVVEDSFPDTLVDPLPQDAPGMPIDEVQDSAEPKRNPKRQSGDDLCGEDLWVRINRCKWSSVRFVDLRPSARSDKGHGAPVRVKTETGGDESGNNGLEIVASELGAVEVAERAPSESALKQPNDFDFVGPKLDLGAAKEEATSLHGAALSKPSSASTAPCPSIIAS